MLGRGLERREFLPAEREKDFSWRGAERGDGFGSAIDQCPAVAGLLLPGGAAQCDGGHAGKARGFGRVGGNLRGIGMGRVDQEIDDAFGEVVGKAFRAAKPAGADRHTLSNRIFGTASERQRDVVAGGELTGKLAGFGGAAKDEDLFHGVAAWALPLTLTRLSPQARGEGDPPERATRSGTCPSPSRSFDSAQDRSTSSPARQGNRICG